MARRLPGGNGAKLTDVSQSAGNRLPRPSHLVFYISFSSRTCPPPLRHSLFCLHSFPRLFRAATLFSRRRGARASPCRRLRAVWSEVILQINLLRPFGRSPSRSERVDYKFKCKPTRAIPRGKSEERSLAGATKSTAMKADDSPRICKHRP